MLLCIIMIRKSKLKILKPKLGIKIQISNYCTCFVFIIRIIEMENTMRVKKRRIFKQDEKFFFFFYLIY